MASPTTFDSETRLTAPGCQFPPIVCVQAAARIWRWCDARPAVEWILNQPLIVGHNVAFDMGVICANWPDLTPRVFAAYREDRVTSTQVRDQLIEIANGNHQRISARKPRKGEPGPYSLAGCAKRRLGIDLAKGEDTWRLRYSELRDTPIELWPADAVQYGLGDVSTAESLYYAQERDAPPEGLPDQFRQSRAEFWLALCAGWGLLVNQSRVDALENFIRAEIAEHRDRLMWEGLLVPDNARLARQFEAEGRPLHFVAPEWKRSVKLAMARTPEGWPRTDKSDTHPEGQPSLAEEHCEQSTDPVLYSFGKYTALATVLNKDVKLLRAGLVHCRYGLADSGRATSFQPNVQNFKVQQYGPEKGPKFGIRECFQPRPGFLYVSADYSGLELCTFAQTCTDLFKQSRLAEILNAGQDAHLEMARNILGISYAQAAAELEADSTGRVYLARQTGKVANFGFPGGLGAAALVLFAWGNYRVRISEPDARVLKATWFRTLPETRLFFEFFGALTENGPARISQLRSNRIRGGLRFTQACNTFFQGPGSDIAKAAGWQITERCHVRELGSPLFGCRMVLFGHDEFVLEAPISQAQEAAEALSDTMTTSARVWLPNVKIKAPPTISTVWSKKAKSKREADGRLSVWSPG